MLQTNKTGLGSEHLSSADGVSTFPAVTLRITDRLDWTQWG